MKQTAKFIRVTFNFHCVEIFLINLGWKEKNEFNRINEFLNDNLHSFDKENRHTFSNMSYEKRTEATFERRTEATFDYNYEHSQYHDHLDSESVCR